MFAPVPASTKELGHAVSSRTVENKVKIVFSRMKFNRNAKIFSLVDLAVSSGLGVSSTALTRKTPAS